ncbi:hypothetical protein DPMN_191107 [Dreissena polymorpha]|uniref:Uncharacterized protein n=1 Tax=Dreissena polymorpha TaxID=45954 RepID=A0A9D3Y082_DREPO|nr:hypothetical protein DPMN_191107 [Dreissena polymorpha]
MWKHVTHHVQCQHKLVVLREFCETSCPCIVSFFGLTLQAFVNRGKAPPQGSGRLVM